MHRKSDESKNAFEFDGVIQSIRSVVAEARASITVQNQALADGLSTRQFDEKMEAVVESYQVKNFALYSASFIFAMYLYAQQERKNFPYLLLLFSALLVAGYINMQSPLPFIYNKQESNYIRLNLLRSESKYTVNDATDVDNHAMRIGKHKIGNCQELSFLTASRLLKMSALQDKYVTQLYLKDGNYDHTVLIVSDYPLHLTDVKRKQLNTLSDDCWVVDPWYNVVSRPNQITAKARNKPLLLYPIKRVDYLFPVNPGLRSTLRPR